MKKRTEAEESQKDMKTELLNKLLDKAKQN